MTLASEDSLRVMHEKRRMIKDSISRFESLSAQAGN